MALAAFGTRIDSDRVRICDGPGRNPAAMLAFRRGNPAITLARTIYFRDRFSEDFSMEPERRRSLLMHELTHVWQYRRLGFGTFMLRYAVELARCGFNAARLYHYVQGETRFAEATLEGQAEMIGDYARATLNGDGAERSRVAFNLEGTGFYGL
jgi:hypothetical protein